MALALLASHQGSCYTDEDRRAAVVQYLLLGNIHKVAHATGIPTRTLYHWTQTEWWAQMLAEVGAEKGAEIDAALSRMIDLAMASVMDRLEQGEYVVARDGRVLRRPIVIKDLLAILTMTLEQRERLRVSTSTAAARMPLREVADRLRAFGARQGGSAAGVSDAEAAPLYSPT
ncbi:hypothetical protein PTE30175_03661 [Pandoraea terrae]|uniref:Uncharacterized protein n=1 Tax=Pandoraea terrae TaxID=1537710 RepID=A0A5E4X9T9_9BURK|nr:hypothetical protein [Pandoraea terrae]VVE33097.1 hypothetical protein PTE30175_03661 [Pandoraea terrae]